MSIKYYENQFFSLQKEIINSLRESQDTSSKITNLTRIGDSIDTLTNNIQHELTNKTQENAVLNDKLKNIQTENMRLKKTLGGLEDDKLGSKQMFQDVKLLYNQQLIFNWILTTGLVGTIYIYMKKNNY